MPKGFQIRGDNKNPHHLSIGTVCLDNNLIALIKKSDGTYTLPRETIYSGESLEDSLKRGVQEELGINIKVLKYLGSLVTYFKRTDGTNIEKTTIYFLSEKIGNSKKTPCEDEISDIVEWVEKDKGFNILEEQNNVEFKLGNLL